MLKVENINKVYKRKDTDINALKDISFNVEEGEFLMIMGCSGSGKSTLLNISMGVSRIITSFIGFDRILNNMLGYYLHIFL